MIICLHTVIWIYLFISNTNDFQKDLFGWKRSKYEHSGS